MSQRAEGLWRSVPALAVAMMVVTASSPVEAGNMITGLDVSVASNNAVTVHNTGSLDWPQSVGAAGTHGYTNGWSHVSGTITWWDNNSNTAMTLGSSGVMVPVSSRVANDNGSRSGSVQLGGSAALGSNLRTAYGAGTSSFTSTVASGSLDYTVSGTVTIEVSDPLITGLSVDVAANNAVTVNNTGSLGWPQSVGSAGTYGYINGWSHVSGTITWKDNNSNTAMTLGLPGVWVPASGRVANSNGSRSGSVQLAGDTTLGAALRSAYGLGTSSFGAVIASGSRDYGVTGTVTVAGLQPDLIVQSPGVGDTFISEGESFTASATVRNNGLGSADSTTLRYLRSTNSYICYTCGVDIVLDTDPVVALGPGAISPEAQSVSMPESIRQSFTYWIGSCVDAVGDESSTTNQCSTGVEVMMPCDALTVRDRTIGTAKTLHACEELTAGPSLTVTTDIGLDLYGGEGVTFVDGFEVEANGKMTASVCGQTLCEEGPTSSPLDPACHPCVQSVCAVDGFCCTDDWDVFCVNKVDTVCDLLCS